MGKIRHIDWARVLGTSPLQTYADLGMPRRIAGSGGASCAWDFSEALASLGGDAEFLGNLAGVFCAAYPTLLRTLQHAIATHRPRRAVHAARLISFAAGNLSAGVVAERGSAVQTLAERLELDAASNALEDLELEANRLRCALAGFASEGHGQAY